MQFDFRTLPPPDRYKLLVGSVVPRPIAFVTTRDADGHNNAAPFSFFNVFSADPAIVVLGIEKRNSGPLKDTVRIIRETREFVVNLVSEEIAERMNICAVDFPEGTDELTEAHLTAAPAVVVKAPLIKESPVNMECRLMEELRFGPEGSRSLVVGEVLYFHIRDDAVNARGHVNLDALRLVGRLAGNSYVHLSDRFDMKRMSHAEWLAKARG
jgi:flavin reductase (DIM6/NTAB) family NADH-FMN oxidoreductase RutF